MKREILINANPRETRVAILEDDQLVELLVDRPDARRMVGDIYLGRVDAVLPGIQAAFVDIGTEKSAFLHASDLVFPENEPSDDDGEGGDRPPGQRVRAQVEAGHPKGAGGVVGRTVGEDGTKETLERELNTLIAQWKRIAKKRRFVKAAARVHRETSLTRGLMRDVFSTKVEQVTVDAKQVYNEIVEYLKGIAPDLIDRIKLYEEQTPLFDKANIEQELRDL